MGRYCQVMIIGLMLELLSGALTAQVLDDFDDGDFIQGVHWFGDTGQFIVDNGELRLFSGGSDSSSLVTMFQSGLDTLEWRFRLRMPFAPSSQNHVRFYLWSDALNLEGPLNGYYLQFGETGSADAFELRYQSGWSSMVLLRGPDSLIASGADIRMKVVRFPGGFWQVAYDPAAGEQFVLSGTAFHLGFPTGSILGLKCTYTSSNAQKCYLDDVYSGSYQRDLEPPKLVSTQFMGNFGLGLSWNEPLDVSSALDTALYRMDPFGTPDSIVSLATDGRSFALYFSGNLEDTVSYLLKIHDLRDASGNVLSDTVYWSVFKVFSAESGQIVFSEIMANPSGTPQLPLFEFVELHNRSSRVLSLAGCCFHDAASSCFLSDDTLMPGSYIAYMTSTAAVAFSMAGFSRCVGIGCFPALNNDGDSLRITGSTGELIDAIDYDVGMYVDPLRDDQGWSLERIDVRSPCSSRENWKASVDPHGGTPGLSNSVQGVFFDTAAPWPVHAYPLDSTTISLYFNEWPDTALAKDPHLYTLEPVGWTATGVRIGTGRPYIDLDWPQPLVSGFSYEVVIDSQLSDCSGNMLKQTDGIAVGLPMPVSYGDIGVNEVLFNPIADDGDFVEIVNRSSHAINLADLRFAFADPSDGVVKNAVGLQTEKRLLMPGDYIVAAALPEKIIQRYPCIDGSKLIRADLSGYDDDEGVVVVLDASLRVLDKFQYSDDYHFPLLADPEGVSLERIRFEGATDDPRNWHSASSQCGYATPGIKNSQHLDPNQGSEEWFSLEPRLFSPDNDGYHDLLQMDAHFPKPGFMAEVNIFNEHGLLVRQIAGNEYLSPDAIWTWNGTSDEGQLMPPGPYVVSARFIHVDGEVRRVRKACVLAPNRMDN